MLTHASAVRPSSSSSGHRGVEYNPGKNLRTGKVSSRRKPRLATDPKSPKQRAPKFTRSNLNDHTVEGLRHSKASRLFSVAVFSGTRARRTTRIRLSSDFLQNGQARKAGRFSRST